MFVFNEKSTRKILTPWGKEVKRRVLDRDITQDEVVQHLNFRGFKISKDAFTKLLYGIGVSARRAEIEAINEYLEIPYEK